MSFSAISLLCLPILVYSQNQTTWLPQNSTTMPSYNTTSMPNYSTTYKPNYNTTSMPNQSTTTTSNYSTTSIPNDFCVGHVCLPEENGFFAEGCCENSYCQCFMGVGHVKYCEGEGVFNEELQACDWDWHVPCCNTSMPTLPTPEERCRNNKCEEDGYFAEGGCEDFFCQCEAGTGFVHHCQDGLFFNPDSMVCDWPWNNPSCFGSTTTTTTESNVSTTSSPDSQCSYNCTEENGVFAEGCCQNTYCQCFGGQGFLQECPPGSVFNGDLGFCDLPGSVDCCNGNSTTTSPMYNNTTTTNMTTDTTTTIASGNFTTSFTTTELYPSSCSVDCSDQVNGHYAEGACLPYFCDCFDGEGTIKNCQPGKVFNEILGYCVSPQNTQGC